VEVEGESEMTADLARELDPTMTHRSIGALVLLVLFVSLVPRRRPPARRECCGTPRPSRRPIT
jgi:hypothetical protein